MIATISKSDAKTINEFIEIGIDLLGIIYELRENSSVDNSTSTREVAVQSVKPRLRVIVEALKVSVWDNDDFNSNTCNAHDDSITLPVACERIGRDVLLRLDLLEKADITFDQAWTDESLAALENHFSWIRAELGAPDLAGLTRELDISSEDPTSGDLNIKSLEGSRRLWTGPAKQHGRSMTTAVERWSSRVEPNSPELVASVKETLRNEDKSELLLEFFLESLTFTSMNDREEEVTEAHHETFEWIFAAKDEAKTDHGNFVSWLTKDESGRIYWINGKAGSGKSTLMRFIADHEATQKHLKTWAGRNPLIVVNFFFWTSGSVLQRSQVGLLRSLLFQLLAQRPTLIPWAFPELWVACQDTKKRVQIMLSWELDDLIKGLRRALELAVTEQKSKICLFFDGLDEFEGDEAVIINLVKDIVELSPNIKACVSSRPWAAFEYAFQNVPHLLLQDLTMADMDKYISDQVQNNAIVRRILRREPDQHQLNEFKKELMNRANGVFLWTTLGLRSIIKSLHKDDKVTDMLQKLLQLPSDLEDLFRHLLFKDREFDILRDQSRAFQFIRARDDVCDFTGDESARSITLYQVAIAYEDSLKPWSTEESILQYDSTEVLAICKRFTDLLDEKCANLVIVSNQDRLSARLHARFNATSANGGEQAVHKEADRRVHYLHRTVRDFFTYSGVWPEIVANGGTSFDSHLSLLRSHILKLRYPLDEPEKHRRIDEWWQDDVVPAMTHARLASLSSNSSTKWQVVLLDLLNDTLQWYWRAKPSDPLDTWPRQAFATYEERRKRDTPYHFAFLSLAAKFGINKYVEAKLGTHEFGYKGGVPLLSHAVELLINRRKTVYPLSSPDVISALVEHDESPNQVYQDLRGRNDTPWLLALKYVREGQRRGWMKPFDLQESQRWVKALDLMLDHGADPNAVILKDEWDPEATALSVVSSAALKYFSSDVYRLMKRLEGLVS